jgi:hypothetical protein
VVVESELLNRTFVGWISRFQGEQVAPAIQHEVLNQGIEDFLNLFVCAANTLKNLRID